eukprot:m.259711 g.259711  ORF g.259711 m.259711 type:complete len:420 (+) comp26643_c0_seq5:1660-2919(+)
MMAGNELRDLVDWERTIGAPKLTSEMTHKMSELRHVLAAAHKGSPHWGGDVMVPLFADDSLHRYLRARGGDVKKAEKMIQKTLEWRLKEEPHLLRAKDFLDIENETGKCRSAGIDRWGRPILILDNTVENTTNVEAHMRLLFYTTERLIRRMKPPVEKQVIFVHLPDFSLWNTPPLKSSKTSLAVFSLYYAERLGHCIFWQPPSYFSTFIAMIRPFIDPATYAKVVVINGDASPGTVNDSKMNVLIGPDWRKKTGAGGTRQTPKSSPGYRHSEYWQGALQEDTAIAAAEANPTAAQNETCPAARGSSMSTNEGLTNHTANTNKDYNSHSQFFRAVKEADMVRIDQVASTTSTIHPATCTNYVRRRHTALMRIRDLHCVPLVLLTLTSTFFLWVGLGRMHSLAHCGTGRACQGCQVSARP